ncbi:MAG TPA: GGDEF domain-containing protein [Methylomirabilota bacterium]|nr:GGDEF domain-containing protein [Methylomirabilota bacterium]
MLSVVTKVVVRLLPGAVLLLAAALVLQSTALRPALWPLVPAYPLVVLGGGILLGWRFDRSRLVLALAVLLLAERALAVWVPASGTGGEVARVVFGALAVLVPLDLAALTWLPERGLLARPGRVALALLAVEVVLVTLLCQPLFLPLAPSRAAMSQLSLIGFLAAGVVAARRAILRATAFESGAVWTLAAAFLAFRTGGSRLDVSLYLTTGGLILVLSLIETWYVMAYDDELTGLPARRALNEALDRLRGTYTVAMVDIDHFKRFNDAHGHDVGDQLLRMVGARLAAIGGGGRAFRYGGEEFAVLFQGKAVDQVRDHLETLRRTIEATPFTLRAPTRPDTRPESPPAGGARRRIAVTVSIGAAGSDGGASAPDQVVRAADEALYRAKQAGRNQLQT